MGLLSEGEPLSWEETKQLASHVRAHATRQFIHLYHAYLNSDRCEVLKWGEEIEFVIIHMDKERRSAKLSLRAGELLEVLQRPEKEQQSDLQSLWRPEYASYMVEGTPGAPYDIDLSHLILVEANMSQRRREVEKLLKANEVLLSISTFPRLGCSDFAIPQCFPHPHNSFTRSLFWPSEATFLGHPRFKTLSRNIRERRGEKVAINVPVFPDENTPKGQLEDLKAYKDDDGVSQKAAKDGHIYMDAMGFGMGLSCLQVTFQAAQVAEAEQLYDQLAPVCPILLALTACSPIFKGFLADVDCRWDIIAASVDDRTREERGLEPLKESRFRIPKSRYDSISTYISTCSDADQAFYNDLDLVYDENVYKELLSEGINPRMAKHISHLFIRDSVSLFRNKVEQDDCKETDHFENLQSTNWQTMRFKPPPSATSEIGFRVEFRPCELQFTDFENAAVTCFVVLLTRCILSFKTNLLIPISKVDENMRRAQKRDAVLNEKFYFRTNIESTCSSHDLPNMVEMSVDQILRGDPALDYKGLIPLVQLYLRDSEVDAVTSCTLSRYWELLLGRSSGRLKTNARFMRDFVMEHEEYKRDSVVSESINYDLIKTIVDITNGDFEAKELFGNVRNAQQPK